MSRGVAKILVLPTRADYAERYPEDTRRIVEALLVRGYTVTAEVAAEAWHRYCEYTSCAGWLDPMNYDDDMIVMSILCETDVIEVEAD